VPKDEQSKIGSAERAIDEIDRMVAASLLDSNIPKCYWDIVGEHCSLLNAVTQSCPTDHGITICEAETGLIPDLDALPPLGCFCVRYLSKMDRKDFKLSPKNQADVFWGFATLRIGTYGSILLIGDRRIVVAKETMDFIHDLFPLKHAPSANSEYAWLHHLLKRYKSPKNNSLTEYVEDVQGNESAALDPSPSFDDSSSADSEDSDPMDIQGEVLVDIQGEVLESLAHLEHAPTPPTIVKFSPIMSSSKFSPPA